MNIVTWPIDQVAGAIGSRHQRIESYDYVTRPEVIRYQIGLSALGGMASFLAVGVSVHHLVTSPPTTTASIVGCAVALVGVSIGFAQLRSAYRLATAVAK